MSFSGRSNLVGLGSDCNDISCADLYMFLFIDNSNGGNQICVNINKNLGHVDLVPIIATSYMFHVPIFTGTYGSFHLANRPQLNGKTSACFKHGSSLENTFYQVLIAR